MLKTEKLAECFVHWFLHWERQKIWWKICYHSLPSVTPVIFLHLYTHIFYLYFSCYKGQQFCSRISPVLYFIKRLKISIDASRLLFEVRQRTPTLKCRNILCGHIQSQGSFYHRHSNWHLCAKKNVFWYWQKYNYSGPMKARRSNFVCSDTGRRQLCGTSHYCHTIKPRPVGHQSCVGVLIVAEWVKKCR